MIGESPMVSGVIHVLTTPAPARRRTASAAGEPAADTVSRPVARRPRATRTPVPRVVTLPPPPPGAAPARPVPPAPQADDDDMSLIRAYRNGDVRAFEVFFSRYRDRIRNLCLRYLPEEAAEDTVQDTFLQFVRTIDRIDESYRVSSWIQRIAVNLCHDELRRRGRRKRLFEPASDVTELAMMSVADGDRTRQPETAQELQRTRNLVWDVAATLPPRQRTVLALRELHGMPYHVIADRLGTSTSAVETLLHRARERFKAEFLRLEGAQPGIAACRTTAHLLEDPAAMRPHQLRRVTTHLGVCARCRLRYAATLDPQVPDRLAS
ncbi:MAG TPA: sigma-70 family RNA polymerase sigma factor [Candidatus Dormibacteraeota bacterium]|jgi:RNA polymerase sigma-70 factor (ECF subfamily)